MPEPPDEDSNTGPGVEGNVPFDRYQLDDLLREIGGHLTELRHIDLVMDYLADRSSEDSYPSYLPAPPGAFHEFDIPLGTTFPFILHFTLYDIDPSYVELHLNHYLPHAATSWATDRMAELYDLVRPIAFPLVSGHDSLIGEFGNAQELLDSIKTDFGGLSNNLSDWKGDAAENFADSFYSPFEDCLRNQKKITLQLLGALLVSKGIIKYTQQTLMNTVSHGRDALRDQLQQRSQGIDAMTLKDFLGVGSTLGSVAGLVLSGVPLVGVTIEVVSAAMGLAAMALPEEPAPLKIEGRSAEELDRSISDRVSEIQTYADVSHDDLYRQLGELQSNISGFRDDKVLLPSRPDLADGVGGNDDFHHTSSDQYTG